MTTRSSHFVNIETNSHSFPYPQAREYVFTFRALWHGLASPVGVGVGAWLGVAVVDERATKKKFRSSIVPLISLDH